MKTRLRGETPVTPAERKVLNTRAQRLQAAPAATVEESLTWLAEFPIGEERFAIPLSLLRSNVPLKRVTPVPLSPPYVIGVLRFQGQIITALSLSALLGGRGWRRDPTVLLVVDPGWGLVALDCEEIPMPITLPAALVERSRDQQSRFAVTEVTTPDMRPLKLIDLARLLDRRTVEARSGG